MADKKPAEKWVPLHIREAGEAEREKYAVLLPTSSVGLDRCFSDFVEKQIVQHQLGGTQVYFHRRQVLAIEQQLGIDLQHWVTGQQAVPPNLMGPYSRFPLEIRLSIVDFCIHHFPHSEAELEDLKDAMERARFVYTVDVPGEKIVRVLPSGVEHAVVASFGASAAEGKMREAVHFATGLKPDPAKALIAMTEAVEAVAKPVLSPNDDKFTLGKALGELRRNPDLLVSSLPRIPQAPEGSYPVPQVVRGMLELIWSACERHGGGVGTPPTVDQARALLGVAGSLVTWFGTGLIKKAP